jgi:hypothetical protein
VSLRVHAHGFHVPIRYLSPLLIREFFTRGQSKGRMMYGLFYVLALGPNGSKFLGQFSRISPGHVPAD